jgi:hypothetical protein
MGDCLMGNVRLYGSTSGYTELAPPAVAPDGVLSLPSGTGTLLTAEGGKVLQIVRATDVTLRTTTSTSFVDASISVTITPQKATSAILLIWSAGVQHITTSDFAKLQITDSSNVTISGAELLLIGSGTTSQFFCQIAFFAYDTPGSTAAKTYKGRFGVDASGTARLLNSSSTGQLFAIEVSA